MSETDLDAKTKLKETEEEVRLPWESIDPPSDYEYSRSASTATKAVEAETTHANRFNSYEDEKDTATPEERDEWHVTHAFFSDEQDESAVTTAGAVVSEEVVAVTPVIAEVVGPVVVEQVWTDGTSIGDHGFSQDVAPAQAITEAVSPELAENVRADSPIVENHDSSEDSVPASAEADPTTAMIDSGSTELARDTIAAAEDAIDFGRVGVPAHHLSSPQNEMAGEHTHPTNRGDWLSVVNHESEENVAIASTEAPPAYSEESLTELRASNEPIEITPAAEQTEIDVTPWATMDETPADVIPVQVQADTGAPELESAPAPQPAALEPEPVEIPENFVALPGNAMSEAAVTFSSSDSIVAAASELATMSEAFGAKPPVETPAAASSEMEGVFVVPMPQAPAAETEPAVESAVDMEADIEAPSVTTGGGWTIPVMCLGIGLIACCMVIPQGEFNRKMRYEQLALKANLQHVQKQVAVNDAFLKNVMDDPTLAQRLAGRQMKTIRKGQKVVPLKQASEENDMSPFALVAVDPPPALPPYHAERGTIADLCNNARARLYLLGIAMAMVAVGLVMGFSPKKDSDSIPEPRA